jgi:hypothetical protein
MSIFDLIFIGFFLGTVFYGSWIACLLIRRRWSRARSHTLRLGTAVGVYVVVVISVGVSSPRRMLASDDILRYDDWCLGVTKAAFADIIGHDTQPISGCPFLIVTLKVVSTAGRVRQAAPENSRVYLLDGNETRYDVCGRGQAAFETANETQPELTTKLDPRSSFLTIRAFEVPRNVKEFSLAHRHGSGFPGALIIGQGFRKPPVIHLQPNAFPSSAQPR